MNKQELKMRNILYEMDENNKKCADCGNNDVSFGSINNGIIICNICANEHKKVGNSLSYLRSFNQKWDDYLLSYIKTGGNSRFIQFVKEYKIDSMEIEKKYKTKACEYYREILRSEVMGYDPPDNINPNSANEILNDIENNYPEFDNYTFVKHVDLDTLEKKFGKKKEEEYSFYDSFTGFFGNMKEKLNEVTGNIANKFTELNVKDTIYANSSKAYNSIKNAAGNTSEKLKDFIGNLVGQSNQNNNDYYPDIETKEENVLGNDDNDKKSDNI